MQGNENVKVEEEEGKKLREECRKSPCTALYNQPYSLNSWAHHFREYIIRVLDRFFHSLSLSLALLCSPKIILSLSCCWVVQWFIVLSASIHHVLRCVYIQIFSWSAVQKRLIKLWIPWTIYGITQEVHNWSALSRSAAVSSTIPIPHTSHVVHSAMCVCTAWQMKTQNDFVVFFYLLCESAFETMARLK